MGWISRNPPRCKSPEQSDMAETSLDQTVLRNVAVWNAARANDPRASANLSRADLAGYDLRGADLTGADLTGANLTDADLRLANLTGAVLDGAVMNGVKLWGSRRAGWSITDVTCSEAAWDEAGEFPLSYDENEVFATIHRNYLSYYVASDEEESPVNADEWQYIAAMIAREGELTVTFDRAGMKVVARSGAPSVESDADIQAYRKKLHELTKIVEEREEQAIREKARMFDILSKRGTFDEGRAGESVMRTVLATDIKSFSQLDSEGQSHAAEALDKFGAILFEHHGAEFGNDWGDALVAVFEHPNRAAEAALKLVAHMNAEGHSIRVGLATGLLTRVKKSVQGKPGFQGEPLVEAARLEPLAEPNEVLAGPSFVSNPELDSSSFRITRVKRTWKKAFGSVKPGDPAVAFQVIRASS
jgi:class 3 adenylate cyclase